MPEAVVVALMRKEFVENSPEERPNLSRKTSKNWNLLKVENIGVHKENGERGLADINCEAKKTGKNGSL